MSHKTLVIAEAGVNHNGSIDIAIQLVEAAANAGADYVKIQTFSAERQVTVNTARAEYQIINTGSSETQYEMLKQLELSLHMHQEIIAACRRNGIGFLSTPFDIESLQLLMTLGIDLIKVPSGELTNLPYLEQVGATGMPIIVSTGMASMNEITDAVGILESSGTHRENITVLHCTTEYPAPLTTINLRAMLNIRDSLEVKIGYSDHSLGITVPIAAVAMGATVIEKHFTLDRLLPGPDHKASLEPSELASMVEAIRDTETALGSWEKVPTAGELVNISSARKSIVSRVAINQGDRFTSSNLTIKRPGTGISPMNWYQVIGTIADRDYAPDEVIWS